MENCDKVDQVNEIKRTQFSALENDMWENRKADRKTISSVGSKHSPERKSKSSLKPSPKLNRDQRQSREASYRDRDRDRDRQVAQELVSRVSAPDARQTWRPELEDEAWIPQPPSGSTEQTRTRRESRSRRRAESEVSEGLWLVGWADISLWLADHWPPPVLITVMPGDLWAVSSQEGEAAEQEQRQHSQNQTR